MQYPGGAPVVSAADGCQTRPVRKPDITPELVEGLVATQFPEWAGLPVTPVEVDGWDNTTFRLGSSMSVRLPSAEQYVAQVDKEHRWLPVLSPQLLGSPGPAQGYDVEAALLDQARRSEHGQLSGQEPDGQHGRDRG